MEAAKGSLVSVILWSYFNKVKTLQWKRRFLQCENVYGRTHHEHRYGSHYFLQLDFGICPRLELQLCHVYCVSSNSARHCNLLQCLVFDSHQTRKPTNDSVHYFHSKLYGFSDFNQLLKFGFWSTQLYNSLVCKVYCWGYCIRLHQSSASRAYCYILFRNGRKYIFHIVHDIGFYWIRTIIFWLFSSVKFIDFSSICMLYVGWTEKTSV